MKIYFIGFLIFALAVSKPLREMLRIPDGRRTPLSFVTGYPDVDYLKVISRNPGRVMWLQDVSRYTVVPLFVLRQTADILLFIVGSWS